MTVLYHTYSGSRLTGLSTPTSDVDTLSVNAYPREYYLGVMAQPETRHTKNGDADVLVHELRKFARLAMAGNYGCLASLFAPSKSVLLMHDAFRPFVVDAFVFVSMRAVASCVGQALTDYKSALVGFSLNDPAAFKAAARSYHLLSEACAMMGDGKPEVEANWFAKDLRQGNLTLDEYQFEFNVQLDIVRRLEGQQPLSAFVNEGKVNQLLLTVFSRLW